VILAGLHLNTAEDLHDRIFLAEKL
jgi:hypothetical protein